MSRSLGLPPVLSRRLLALVLAPALWANPCATCHPKEAAAYSHSAMSRSLRRAGSEPEGGLTTSSGTRFTVRSDGPGARQRMERNGEVVEYPVAYVIGSGTHASGYLIQIGDYLFQSPICYYTSRHSYGLAPGYERLSDPDYTRPVTEECLLCHSGRPLPVAGAANRYRAPIFTDEISCERCHGPAAEHLLRPVPGSVVNPAKLTSAARDSICEQCHLAGAERVLNPGMDFADFRPGLKLEDVFTVYVRDAPAGASRAFKVISHAEQLARSACARNSQGRLWCGTCHDPHPTSPQNIESYNLRCGSCHRNRLSASHPAGLNCVGCHMTRRQAQDGGHTVFTDHRISRRPLPDSAEPPPEDLAPWREPAPAFASRNLALAYVNVGITNRSPAQMVRGYRMLTEVQKAAPDDIVVLKAIGRALLLGKQPAEALRAFERVLELEPNVAANEENAGIACLESRRLQESASHLERALKLDPLLLSAATALEQTYRQQGEESRAAAVAKEIQRVIRGSAAGIKQ